MFDCVARFIFRNAYVCRLRHTEIAGRAVSRRMPRIAIVRIDDVTGRASRRTIVARMIIRAEKVECRIMQPGLLQAEINRISSLRGPQTAGAQSLVRLARILVLVRQANFQTTLTAAFKDAQDIAW